MLFKIILILYCTSIQVFAKNRYYIYHDHMTTEDVNRDYFAKLDCRNTMYNRTTRTFTIDVDLLQDLPPEAKLKVLSYQFRSNRYQLFAPLRVDLKLCDIFKVNPFGLGDLVKMYSDMKPECPISKGKYIFNQLTYDGSGLPPNIPFGKYKLLLDFHIGKNTFVKLAWFGELREPKN